MIAIHNSKQGFHPRWEHYCKEHNLPYKLVNCYATDIMSQLKGCKALLWHHNHMLPRDVVFAKQLMFALEHCGMPVFPDFKTAWHFDDKVAQKYLFEVLGIPSVNANVFYDKQSAILWARNTEYPKVFKLRGGAGSTNVRLVKSIKHAERLIAIAFGKGFPQYDKLGSLKERWRKYRLGKTSVFDVVKGILRFFKVPEYAKIMGREKGYVYFQDFVAGNDHDIRVIVIGEKAIAIKRMVRKNDFRASGSGHILYDKELFDNELIKLSFDLHKKIQSQCSAFDFIFEKGVPKVVEVSYGFVPEGYDACPGYWDSQLQWHNEPFTIYGWIIENLLQKSEKL